MNRCKLTKTVVDRLEAGDQAQRIVRDTELKGFGIRVGATAKTYFVEKRVGRRNVRSSIGRHGQITCEQARRKAQVQLGKMTDGADPNAERKAERARSITLRQAYDAYLETRNALRPTTLRSYNGVVETVLADWTGRPLQSITKDMIAARHRRMSKENGPALANLAMRLLRAVFNFAQAKYEDSSGAPLLAVNPVERLSQTRAWNHIARRQSVIPRERLGDWLAAVRAHGDEPAGRTTVVAPSTVRDYLLLLLFTGLRREEGARLRWQDIDLKARTLTVHETKNGDPFVLPLSDFVYDMLNRRRQECGVGYVFPSGAGRGPIVNIRKQMGRITEASGVPFTLHDLRRTFTTIADGIDLSQYAVKRLLNHRSGNDVTAGYIVHSVDRLREPIQRIADTICLAANPLPNTGKATIADGR